MRREKITDSEQIGSGIRSDIGDRAGRFMAKKVL